MEGARKSQLGARRRVGAVLATAFFFLTAATEFILLRYLFQNMPRQILAAADKAIKDDETRMNADTPGTGFDSWAWQKKP